MVLGHWLWAPFLPASHPRVLNLPVPVPCDASCAAHDLVLPSVSQIAPGTTHLDARKGGRGV